MSGGNCRPLELQDPKRNLCDRIRHSMSCCCFSGTGPLQWSAEAGGEAGPPSPTEPSSSATQDLVGVPVDHQEMVPGLTTDVGSDKDTHAADASLPVPDGMCPTKTTHAHDPSEHSGPVPFWLGQDADTNHTRYESGPVTLLLARARVKARRPRLTWVGFGLGLG